MPVVIQNEEGVRQEEENIDSLLYNEDGSLTLEADTLAGFLSIVDWNDILDEEDWKELGEADKVYVKVDGDSIKIVDKDTDGAEEIEVESISGEKFAELVDVNDLVDMFEWMLNDMTPEDLEDKARIACFLGEEEVDEEDLDEKAKGPFKKGAFRKIHKAGGKDQVARMLVAMMKKEAIKRAKKAGAGYKGGDYVKKPGGYPKGTPKGVKKWKKYKTGKGKAAIAKAKKKAKKGAKAAARIAGSVEEPKGGSPKIMEGSRLAGAMLGKMKGRTIVEENEQK